MSRGNNVCAEQTMQANGGQLFHNFCGSGRNNYTCHTWHICTVGLELGGSVLPR